MSHRPSSSLRLPIGSDGNRSAVRERPPRVPVGGQVELRAQQVGGGPPYLAVAALLEVDDVGLAVAVEVGGEGHVGDVGEGTPRVPLDPGGGDRAGGEG